MGCLGGAAGRNSTPRRVSPPRSHLSPAQRQTTRPAWAAVPHSRVGGTPCPRCPSIRVGPPPQLQLRKKKFPWPLQPCHYAAAKPAGAPLLLLSAHPQRRPCPQRCNRRRPLPKRAPLLRPAAAPLSAARAAALAGRALLWLAGRCRQSARCSCAESHPSHWPPSQRWCACHLQGEGCGGGVWGWGVRGWRCAWPSAGEGCGGVGGGHECGCGVCMWARGGGVGVPPRGLARWGHRGGPALRKRPAGGSDAVEATPTLPWAWANPIEGERLPSQRQGHSHMHPASPATYLPTQPGAGAGAQPHVPSQPSDLPSQGVGAHVTKNWLPLVLGPALAMDRTPAPYSRKEVAEGAVSAVAAAAAHGHPKKWQQHWSQAETWTRQHEPASSMPCPSSGAGGQAQQWRQRPPYTPGCCRWRRWAARAVGRPLGACQPQRQSQATPGALPPPPTVCLRARVISSSNCTETRGKPGGLKTHAGAGGQARRQVFESKVSVV